jgi:hypothetical protein
MFSGGRETLYEWTGEAHAQEGADIRAGTVVPLVIRLPEDEDDAEESTSPDANPSIDWLLTVQAKTSGVSFKAEFDLPVFRVENEGLIERRPAAG